MSQNIRQSAFTSEANGIARDLRNIIGIYSSQGTLIKNDVKAVWDTGANGCVINETLAKSLNLIPVSQGIMETVGGKRLSNIYFVNLLLPNNFFVNSVQIMDGILGNDTDMLIGMNVIAIGDFAITNTNGKTAFSFRVPSIKKIDFVKDINNANLFVKPQTPSKKSKCPCNSGKLYKDCCGKK